MSAKGRILVKDKPGNGWDDEGRQALQSEDDDEYDDRPPHSPASYAANGRTSSQAVLSTAKSFASEPAPGLRRTHTVPLKLDTRLVKVLYDFAGDATDELPLYAGQIVEVKKEVSDDWWIGECEGHSGLFPSTYCEEYVPTPVTAVPTMPTRPRTLPPPAGGNVNARAMPPPIQPTQPVIPPSPMMDYHTESGSDSQDLSDADHDVTSSLAAAAQPMREVRLPIKKHAPPPPPSRRSASSSNVPAAGQGAATYLSPPPPAFARPRASTVSRKPALESSPEGSPFAGSEDDEDGKGTPSTRASALSHGLGGAHLRQEGNGGVAACGVCGCVDFTQNVFKAKGTCSTCFHQH